PGVRRPEAIARRARRPARAGAADHALVRSRPRHPDGDAALRRQPSGGRRPRGSLVLSHHPLGPRAPTAAGRLRPGPAVHRRSLQRPASPRSGARAQGVPDRSRWLRARDLHLDLPASAHRAQRHRDAAARALTMIASADVVVVGSGAFGASAAYHLAQRGARVVVLERAALASQTSPRAAGLTSQVRATPALTRLAQRAVTKLAAFTAETGQPLRFTQSGALKIARNERDAEQLAREVARADTVGVDVDFISVAEARRRLPILGERGIAAITWSPTDCNVEPSELPIGYCRAAEKLGAVLLPHTPATGFEIGSGG